MYAVIEHVYFYKEKELVDFNVKTYRLTKNESNAVNALNNRISELRESYDYAEMAKEGSEVHIKLKRQDDYRIDYTYEYVLDIFENPTVLP